MIKTIEAIFEEGVFRPRQPVSLREGTSVKLTFEGVDNIHAAPAGAALPAVAAIARIAELPREGAAAPTPPQKPVSEETDRYVYGDRSRGSRGNE